jgi:transcriptional regulator with XRE-family HTH domain
LHESTVKKMFLENLRVQQKISQQTLAEKTHITRQMISAIENGASPSVATAKKIAAVLGFDWTRFFEPDDDPAADVSVDRQAD